MIFLSIYLKSGKNHNVILDNYVAYDDNSNGDFDVNRLTACKISLYSIQIIHIKRRFTVN